MKTSKKIITVWNAKANPVDLILNAVKDSYKNDTPLDENISDLFTYSVYETEADVRLIIDFI